MVHPLPRTLAVFIIGVAALTPSAAGFETTLEPAAFLRKYGGFSAQDVARAAAGTAVARSIQSDADEVAIAGAVSIGVSRQLFMERFRDIAAFKRAPAVLAIGRFSSPPSRERHAHAHAAMMPASAHFDAAGQVTATCGSMPRGWHGYKPV